MARIVVVGAGISGLVAATWLADFGHEVTVCERSADIGGRHGSHIHDGTAVDLMPGPFTLPAVYRDLFRKTGRPLERVLDLEPADPAIGYRFPDGTELDLPNASRGGSLTALDKVFGPGAGAAWQAAIRYGGEVWANLRSPHLEAAPTRRQLALLAAPTRRRVTGLNRTLRALCEETFTDRRLGLMLEHLATGADPRRAPAGLAAIAYLHQTFGRWYVPGGMYRLTEAVGQRAIDRGAVVRTSSTVAELVIQGRRVVSVRLTDGELVAADVVVAAVDAKHLYGDLLPARIARRTRRRVARLANSPGLFKLFLTVPTRTAPHHTVLFSPDVDGARDAIAGAHSQPPVEPTVNVYTPPGGDVSTVTALVPGHSDDGLVPGTVDWSTPGLAGSFANHLLGIMNERGVDLRGADSAQSFHTPHDVAAETNAAGGAAWGSSLDSAASLLRRPLHRTPVTGLFCVGTSAYPGPGLPLVGLSSMMVADLIGRA